MVPKVLFITLTDEEGLLVEGLIERVHVLTIFHDHLVRLASIGLGLMLALRERSRHPSNNTLC
jgi:hypothetical protein